MLKPDLFPKHFPDEIRPDLSDRKVFFLQYNGDTNLSLFQPDKDIRLPTLQYCPYGGFNR